MPKPILASNRSAPHQKMLEMLQELFPNFTILNEVNVKVGDQNLFLDILVKELCLAVECHGRQHDEFVPHFHGTQESFRASQNRDRVKQMALEGEGYQYLALSQKRIEKMSADDLLVEIAKIGQ